MNYYFILFTEFVPTTRTVQQIQWSIELFSVQEELCDFNDAVKNGLALLRYIICYFYSH